MLYILSGIKVKYVQLKLYKDQLNKDNIKISRKMWFKI